MKKRNFLSCLLIIAVVLATISPTVLFAAEDIAQDEQVYDETYTEETEEYTAGVLGQTKRGPARWGQGSLQKALIFSFCAGHPLPPTADTSDTAPPQWRAESPEYSIFHPAGG